MGGLGGCYDEAGFFVSCVAGLFGGVKGREGVNRSGGERGEVVRSGCDGESRRDEIHGGMAGL